MAAGDLRLYDPDQVTIVVAGIPCKGWADGEFCRIEYETDAFSDVCGTDGEVTRSKSNDGRATVTLRLMQTSPTNALLSALHSSDLNAPGGIGVGPFLLIDGSGATTHAAEKCWIAMAPNSVWDRTPTEREWKIRCAKLVGLEGGNA
jgi:hypothetical protein